MDKNESTYPKEFLDHIYSIKNKRAKIVIDHIMQYGFITTEDLENIYGYSHPPRAARDVREVGVPLETFKVKSKEGKSIAAYKLGDIAEFQANRIRGRIRFSKKFKKTLYKACYGKCAVCNGKFAESYLQVDHKIPYEVGGNISSEQGPDYFMLLCNSCNRAKSWSCEHCDNQKTNKSPYVCLKCYWGNPTDYNHIALKEIRRLDLQWEWNEVICYDTAKLIAKENGLELPDFVKQIIENISLSTK